MENTHAPAVEDHAAAKKEYPATNARAAIAQNASVTADARTTKAVSSMEESSVIARMTARMIKMMPTTAITDGTYDEIAEPFLRELALALSRACSSRRALSKPV